MEGTQILLSYKQRMIYNSYKIIAYPLDATIKTDKLFYCGGGSTHQDWSYNESDAVVYTEYMQAFTDLMAIKRKNSMFLILIYPKTI